METYRLTLSCTICHTRKSCLGDGKKCFRVTFAASFRVILSNLDCKTVKVTLQNSQSETARLTWWRAKTDCFAGNLHGFWRHSDTTKNRKFAYHIEYQQHTQPMQKRQKNRRKIAGRKTRRFLRRFFRVKIVSCTPCFGLRLILFWHVFLRFLQIPPWTHWPLGVLYVGAIKAPVNNFAHLLILFRRKILLFG